MKIKKIALFILFSTFALTLFYVLKKDKVDNSLETVKIKISKKKFKKIKEKRKEALDLGILLTSKEDYVSVKFLIDSQAIKSKMRLKGDWVDHLEHENKWSFRIKLEKENTFHGMQKFSLQHPGTRNYIYEWVFHKMQKDFGLISLRYEFVNLILEVGGQEKHLGIYVLEEAFDNKVLENNNNEIGPIIKFDESQLWENRAYARLHDTAEIPFEEAYQNAEVAAFSNSKQRKDSIYMNQFKTAAYLLDMYRKKQLFSNQVFDLEKMAKFLAIVDLLGGEHAVIWHNVRFYFNPSTKLLEPIGFDAIGGKKYEYVIQNHIMGSDSIFVPYLNKQLEAVINESFVSNFLNTYQTEMNEIIKVLNTEFDDIVFDVEILKHNQNTIKNHLNKQNQTYLNQSNKKPQNSTN